MPVTAQEDRARLPAVGIRDGLAELYHVEFGTAGAPVKLNPPRVGVNVFLHEITDDGS